MPGEEKPLAPYEGPPLCPLMYSVTPKVEQNPLDPKRGSITHEPMVHPCVRDACMLFDRNLVDCKLNVGMNALVALSKSAEDLLRQGDTQ